jgi:hypothetical protein
MSSRPDSKLLILAVRDLSVLTLIVSAACLLTLL